MWVVHQHVKKNDITQKARLLLSEKQVALEAIGWDFSQLEWNWSLRMQLCADRTVIHTSGPRTQSGLEEEARLWRNEWMSSGHACWGLNCLFCHLLLSEAVFLTVLCCSVRRDTRVCWEWFPERCFLSISMGPDIVIYSEESSSKTVPKPNVKSLLKDEGTPRR